ncbi:MAG: lycopene cyclase domain-containing protein [Acidimicrobiales bacterium]
MNRFEYLILMGLCVALTIPLQPLFGARICRRPRRLARTLLPVVAVFYLWDALAIARGHWWFDRRYATGVELPLGVPIEELVFFIVIPLCALLTFEAVRNLLAGTTPVQLHRARRRRARTAHDAGHPGARVDG